MNVLCLAEVVCIAKLHLRLHLPQKACAFPDLGEGALFLQSPEFQLVQSNPWQKSLVSESCRICPPDVTAHRQASRA
jgi:hypothetical protein